jgi:hypothetical protein
MRIPFRKGTHKVDFIAEKPQPTKVRFTTCDGERVKFIATKDQPTEVTFWAKNKPGHRK